MAAPVLGAVGKSTVAGLMLALFVAALDSTVVATAMPTVAAALGGEVHYAWPMTAYLVASTVSTLLCGGLAFSFGLRRVYVAGLALFAASSVLCALAPTIEALAAFRLLQGVGGGVLEAGVFIAAAMMLEPRDRGPYLGAASAMYGIASVVGPVIGGAVAQGLSWHVIFVVNLPISIVALFLSGRCLPGRAPGAPATGFDISGSVVASLCVLSLVLAFSLAGSVFPMASPQFAVLVVLSVACAALLSRVERGKAAPTVPMGLFRRGQVVAGFASGFCVQFALMAGVSYLPRLLQEGLGMAAASSGAVLIPMTLALMAGGNASGAAFRATGRLRAIATASSAVVLAASAAFSAMSPMLAVASCATVAAALVLGVGIGMPVSNLAAQTGADPADAGRATSMAMFFRGFGGTVSVAACGILAPAATAAGTAAVAARCAWRPSPAWPRRGSSRGRSPRRRGHLSALSQPGWGCKGRPLARGRGGEPRLPRAARHCRRAHPRHEVMLDISSAFRDWPEVEGFPSASRRSMTGSPRRKSVTEGLAKRLRARRAHARRGAPEGGTAATGSIICEEKTNQPLQSQYGPRRPRQAAR